MAWIRQVLAVISRVLLCIVGGLLLCSIAPKVLGWHSDVVLTGSMLPMMRPGDVVAYQPVPASRLETGQVIVFHDPTRPGQLLSHRLVRRLPDGQLITKGDANPHEDSTPVSPSAVLGVGRLSIPRVGLPVIWWSQGHRERTAVTAGGILVVVLLASSGPKERRGPDSESDDAESESDQPTPPQRGRHRQSAGAAPLGSGTA